jgi:hypothetical protein
MSNVKTYKLQEALRDVRQAYYDAIASEIHYSTKTYAEIAELHGVSEQTVFQVAKLHGLCRSSQRTDNQKVSPSEISLDGGNYVKEEEK